MEIVYEGEEYELEFDDITAQQAKLIKDRCGLTIAGLQEGLSTGDADALRALFWLMMVQSGVTCNLDTVDFKVVKFISALTEASQKMDEEQKAAQAAAAREKRAAARRKPAAAKAE